MYSSAAVPSPVPTWRTAGHDRGAGAARATGVSWLIDPQTVQQAEVLPSRTVLEGGREVAGTGSAAARGVDRGLRKSTAVADVSGAAVLLPDAVGDVRGGLGGDLRWQQPAPPPWSRLNFNGPCEAALSGPTSSASTSRP